MRFAFLDRLMTHRRRSTGPRPAAQSRRPQLESMEDRRLLSTTPLMQIHSQSVVEGTGGITPMAFKVTLTNPSSKTVTVNYRTIDQAAKAGLDYIAASGQLTFSPGEMTKTIDVGITADGIVEPNEAFYVAISGAKNALAIKTLGIGTIVDDDAVVTPELTVNDVAMKRGLDGYRFMVFTVSLNTTNFTSPITVKASTTAITARAGTDFETTAESLTFMPGERTKEVAVKIFGTSKVTSDKVFYVGLTDSSVDLARPNGGGVIRYGA